MAITDWSFGGVNLTSLFEVDYANSLGDTERSMYPNSSVNVSGSLAGIEEAIADVRRFAVASAVGTVNAKFKVEGLDENSAQVSYYRDVGIYGAALGSILRVPSFNGGPYNTSVTGDGSFAFTNSARYSNPKYLYGAALWSNSPTEYSYSISTYGSNIVYLSPEVQSFDVITGAMYVKYRLSGSTPVGVYSETMEVTIKAKNQAGWSTNNAVYRISTTFVVTGSVPIPAVDPYIYVEPYIVLLGDDGTTTAVKTYNVASLFSSEGGGVMTLTRNGGGIGASSTNTGWAVSFGQPYNNGTLIDMMLTIDTSNPGTFGAYNYMDIYSRITATNSIGTSTEIKIRMQWQVGVEANSN